MSEEKNLHLSKQTMPQLLELLDRQKALLRNRKLLERLKDKGESVKQLHDKLEKEIKLHKDLESVQVSLSALNINNDHGDQKNAEFLKEKHIEYVCSKENLTEDTRYRPHRTLLHKATKTSPQKSPNKFVEVTSAFEPDLEHEPTICLPLAESLFIQNDQAQKILEVQAKKALKSLNYVFAESDGDDEEDKDDDEEKEQEFEDEMLADADSEKMFNVMDTRQ